MLKSVHVFAALLLVAGVTGKALAAGPGDDAGPKRGAGSGAGAGYGQKLKRLDADKDGAISKAEFADPRVKKFKDLDANKDGAVDGAEIEAPLLERTEYRVKRQIKKLDANADGKISRDEFQAGPRERFRMRDLNSDGKLTADDFPPGQSQKRSWFSSNGTTADGEPRKQGRAALNSLEAVDAKSAAEFAILDANADAAVDLEELKKQALERIAFSKKRMLHTLDADTDGRLTEAEFTAKYVKRFATLDLNDDGRLASDDFAPSTRGWLFGK